MHTKHAPTTNPARSVQVGLGRQQPWRPRAIQAPTIIGPAAIKFIQIIGPMANK